MKQLKYFLLGAISILWIVPIAEKLIEVIYLWIETLKVKPSMKIMNYQKDMTILREFTDPTITIYEDEYEEHLEDD